MIAEIDSRPIEVIQIINPAQEDSHYWGNDISSNLRAIDIWIGDKNDLGKGYGTTMMQLALIRCFADPLASNTRAHRLYERLGFQFVEQRQFGDEECFVYQLNHVYFENAR